MKKILIIDDSALMRRVMSDIINTDSEMCVTDTAENGVAAAALLKQGKEYQLILLDINMPRMDGLGFLKYLNDNEIHIPVLVVSSIASKSTEETIRALELGAYDFVKKPSRSMGKEEDFPKRLLAKAKCAFAIQTQKPKHVERQEAEKATPDSMPVKKKAEKKVIPDSAPVEKKAEQGKTKRTQACEFAVIASSTGGPKALQSVVPKLPKTFPCPLVIVQHMPTGFTASLAKRLDEMSACKVLEAEDGMEAEAGKVYVAKGGYQLRVEKDSRGKMVFSVKKEPVRNGLRPCADVFLESLVETPYQNILCTVLTGMGNDATHGLELLKEKKELYAIGQSERTCVVYGMPFAIEKAGLSDEILDLEQIADAMFRRMK